MTIVRGADEPRLDKYDLERIIRASKTYRTFMKKRPSTHTKVTTDNTSVRLILDLQIYLRLLSKERDADQIRDLIAEDSTAEALEVLIAPFFEFLKRTYKIGNAAQAVVDLQKFMDQLIIIVDALRSRIQGASLRCTAGVTADLVASPQILKRPSAFCPACLHGISRICTAGSTSSTPRIPFWRSSSNGSGRAPSSYAAASPRRSTWTLFFPKARRTARTCWTSSTIWWNGTATSASGSTSISVVGMPPTLTATIRSPSRATGSARARSRPSSSRSRGSRGPSKSGDASRDSDPPLSIRA